MFERYGNRKLEEVPPELRMLRNVPKNIDHVCYTQNSHTESGEEGGGAE